MVGAFFQILVCQLNLHSPCTEFVYHATNPLFVNNPHAAGGDVQGDVTLFIGQPESFLLEIDIKTATVFVVGVAHMIPEHGFPTGDVADSTHNGFLVRFTNKKRGANLRGIRKRANH